MVKYERDEVLITITFVIGFVGGFYFFMTGYAPFVEQVQENVFVEDEAVVESLVISASQYGVCERSQQCASFLLEYDGSYSYLPGSVLVDTRPIQGVIPRAVLSDVKSVTSPNRLLAARQSISATTCNSAVDANDFRYEIVRDGELYILDTCITALRNDAEMSNALGAIWEYVGQ